VFVPWREAPRNICSWAATTAARLPPSYQHDGQRRGESGRAVCLRARPTESVVRLLAALGCDAASGCLGAVHPESSRYWSGQLGDQILRYREASFRRVLGELFEDISLGASRPESSPYWTSVDERWHTNVSWITSQPLAIIASADRVDQCARTGRRWKSKRRAVHRLSHRPEGRCPLGLHGRLEYAHWPTAERIVRAQDGKAR
jgi:hypothetical protein